MIVAIGCDHAGFPLKARVVRELDDAGHRIVDCGGYDATPSDYPDFARAVATVVIEGRSDRGILVCGSGVGASVAANKVRGARAALCHDTFSARQGVEDDDLNILCLGARVVGVEAAAECIRAFLTARFSNAERHARRLAKVLAIEADTRAGIFDRPGTR
ncbi:MAG: ribose 5-phosphate isomerase B [Deltaproteobacteria bacterium]|nr:ribose 5-phosphate isomerase B [Deltaproteobacteria bacterium]